MISEKKVSIQLLRSIAVISVILFHANSNFLPGGYLGVDIFFVLTGYLITAKIISLLDSNNFNILQFYLGRCRRILPSLLFLILLLCPIAILFLMPDDIIHFSKSVLSSISGFSNLYFWLKDNYFEKSSDLRPLLHTWSLSLEFQFYIFFPIYLAFLYRKARKFIAPILLLSFLTLIIISLYFKFKFPVFQFYSPFGRLWAFVLGSIYFIYQNKFESIRNSFYTPFLLIGLLSPLVYCSSESIYSFPLSLLCCLSAALLINYESYFRFHLKYFSMAIFLFIGDISYSLYLYHFPIFSFYKNIFIVDPTTSINIILILLTLIFSYINYISVESYYRHRISSRKFIYSILATYLVVILICFASIFTSGFLHFRSLKYKNLIEAKHERELTENRAIKCKQSVISNLSLCKYGDVSIPPIVGILGDSHAATLITTLSELGVKNHFSFIDFSYPGCKPFPKNIIATSVDEKYCDNLRQYFFDNLSTNMIPKVIVIYARWGDDLTYFNKNIDNPKNLIPHIRNLYSEYINRIINSGRVVILIYPTPIFSQHVPNYLFKLLNLGVEINPNTGQLDYSIDRNSYSSYKNILEIFDGIPNQSNLIRLKPSQYFCDFEFSKTCKSHLNGLPIVYDTNHLSNYGAIYISKDIYSKIKPVN